MMIFAPDSCAILKYIAERVDWTVVVDHLRASSVKADVADSVKSQIVTARNFPLLSSDLLEALGGLGCRKGNMYEALGQIVEIGAHSIGQHYYGSWGGGIARLLSLVRTMDDATDYVLKLGSFLSECYQRHVDDYEGVHYCNGIVICCWLLASYASRESSTLRQNIISKGGESDLFDGIWDNEDWRSLLAEMAQQGDPIRVLVGQLPENVRCDEDVSHP